MRTICWRLSSWDPDVASVRCRAAIPALHLKRRGVTSRFSSGTAGVLEPNPPDAVVFVKAFGARDVEHALAAAQARVPVVLDICDNVFASGYHAHSSENLRQMAEVATAIVTTGPALATVLRRELGGVRLHVVPDPVETPGDVYDVAKMLHRERLARALHERRPTDVPRAGISSLRRKLVPRLRRHGLGPVAKGLPQVLWFGNLGSVEPRFGIVNLADIAAELEAAAQETPFRLVVLTRGRGAYREHVGPLALETVFARWDRLGVFRHVRESAAVILPNSRDTFSICKSANRAVLALSQGVPVVATSIPALEPLAGAMLFDDFRAGTVAYLRDRALAGEHVRRAGEVIRREFAPGTVAEAWRSVLEGACVEQGGTVLS